MTWPDVTGPADPGPEPYSCSATVHFHLCISQPDNSRRQNGELPRNEKQGMLAEGPG